MQEEKPVNRDQNINVKTISGKVLKLKAKPESSLRDVMVRKDVFFDLGADFKFSKEKVQKEH